MRLSILTTKISWFGKQSGYEALTDYYPANSDMKIFMSGDGWLGKIVGKAFQIYYKWTWVNPQDIFTEIKFWFDIDSTKTSHIIYLENHIQIVEKVKKGKRNLIGTVHIPINLWEERDLKLLGKIENIIILYEKEIPQYSKYIDLKKIHFIRHGVNIDFFKPIEKKAIIKNKVLIVGHFLRNFDMLFQVYSIISNRPLNKIEFHIIIPSTFRNIPILATMSKNKNVFFYEKLSDQQLLDHYQNSYVFLAPMNNSGANSAIVQAISCGLPVITTDVGGIRSYGGGDAFPLIENNDVNNMVSLFDQYYKDEEYHDLIASKQRQFAVDHLDWKIIAQQHLDLYQLVSS